MGAMRVRPLLGLVLCLSLAISQGQLISSNPNSTAGVSAPPSQEQLAATKANAERNLAEAQAHIDASNARQKQLYEAQVAYQKKEGLPISPASYVSGLPTLPVSVGPPLMPASTASVSPAPLPPRKFTSPAKKSFAPPPAKKGAQKGQKAGSGAKGSGGKGGKSGKRKRFAQVMGIHPSESPAAAETAESSSSVLHAEAEAAQSESSSFRFSNAAQSPMDAMNKLANMQPPKVVALPAEAMNPADIEASLAATLKAAADGQKNTKPISDAEAKQATQALLSAAAASKATADATKAKADKQAEALDNERAKEKAAAAAANFAAASRLQAAAEARLITQLHAKLEAEANDKTHESPATLELYYLNKKAANPHSGKETETIPSLPDGFEEDTLYNETVNIGITKLPAFEPVPEDRTRKQNETRYLPTEDLAPSTYEGVHRLKVERELVAIKRSHDFDGFKLPKKAPKWVAKYNLQRTVPGVPTPLNGKSLATNTTAATNGTASAPISSSAVSPQVTIVAPAAAAAATNQTAAAPTPSAPKPHVGGHHRNSTNSTQHLHPIAVDNVHVKVSPL